MMCTLELEYAHDAKLKKHICLSYGNQETLS